jgi:hypothetical protein
MSERTADRLWRLPARVMGHADRVTAAAAAVFTLWTVLLLHTELYIGTNIWWAGDGRGNLARVWYVRQDLRALWWTPQWFGDGYSPLLHPYSKVLYPPWWLTYLPGLDPTLAVRVLIIAHGAGGALLSFVIARRRTSLIVALCCGALAVAPMGGFRTHIWKYLAWPWLLLAVWATAPWVVRQRPALRGVLIGGALGLAALTGGGIYYVFIGGLVTAPWIVTGGPRTIVGAVGGGLVALPKLPAYVTSLSAPRPPAANWAASLVEVARGLTGLGYLRAGMGDTGLFEGAWEAFAVIGLPAVLVALAGFAVLAPQRESAEARWARRALIGGGLAVVFATGGLRTVLGAQVLRTEMRGIHGLAVLCCVAVAVVAMRLSRGDDKTLPWLRRLLAAVLVLSAVQAGATAATYDVSYEAGFERPATVADRVAALDCGPVWIESTRVPKSMAQYALAKEQIGVVNPLYPDGFAAYTARQPDGMLTPSVILIGQPAEADDPLQLRRAGTAGAGTDVAPGEREYVGEYEEWHVYLTDRC